MLILRPADKQPFSESPRVCAPVAEGPAAAGDFGTSGWRGPHLCAPVPAGGGGSGTVNHPPRGGLDWIQDILFLGVWRWKQSHADGCGELTGTDGPVFLASWVWSSSRHIAATAATVATATHAQTLLGGFPPKEPGSSVVLHGDPLHRWSN